MKQFALIPIWLGIVVLVLSVGCKTTDTAHTGNLASVIITGTSAAKIQQATIETFDAHGYKKTTNLSFEKVGSSWDQINYGGMGSEPVWIKLQIKFTEEKESEFILNCNAYLVSDHSDNLIKDERELKYIKAGESKKILDEIKHRLSATPH